jgi:hypothetical protein
VGSGHTGIAGNGLADTAAKKAAVWRPKESGKRVNQPRRLYLLRATVGTWIKREAQKEWEYTWTTETRGRTSHRHSPNLTHRVLRLHEKLRKRHSSMLRTEKIGLRDFLFHRWGPKIQRCHVSMWKGATNGDAGNSGSQSG